MRASTIAVLASIAVAASAASAADAQAVLRGTVRDADGRALAGAEVVLEGTRWQTRTDSAGRYILSVDPETYSVLFRQLGHGPLTRRARLTRGAVTVLDATLAAGEAPQLDTVEVRARRPRGIGREAFEERRALGLGKFIDSAQLRKMEGRRVADVLRDQGVKIWTTKGAIQRMYAANPIKMTMDGRPSCYMTVILDGTTIYRYRFGSDEPPPDFSREFNIVSLDAIEVYRGAAQVPLEFSGRGVDCGVIVMWTRRGR